LQWQTSSATAHPLSNWWPWRCQQLETRNNNVGDEVMLSSTSLTANNTINDRHSSSLLEFNGLRLTSVLHMPHNKTSQKIPFQQHIHPLAMALHPTHVQPNSPPETHPARWKPSPSVHPSPMSPCSSRPERPPQGARSAGVATASQGLSWG
jgi:hypothetical protein